MAQVKPLALLVCAAAAAAAVRGGDAENGFSTTRMGCGDKEESEGSHACVMGVAEKS